MKHLKVALALGLASVGALTSSFAMAQSAPPPVKVIAAPEPARLALAKEIISIVFPPAEREAMMHKLVANMTAQFSAGIDLSSIEDKGARDLVKGYLDSIPVRMQPMVNAFIPKQMEVTARAYARMYTEQQLTDVLAFAKTPSGAAFLQHSMDVMSDPEVAEANTDYFKDVMGESQKLGAEMTQAIAAYAKEHPNAFPSH